MDLKARCVQIAAELNQAEGWGLPSEALELLARQVRCLVPPTISPADLHKVTLNYFHDGPQVEAMAQPGLPEGERYWQEVRAWFVRQATSYGVAPNEAEDVAQEAWRKARRGLPSFAFRGRLRAWLKAIIVHACHQWYQRQKHRPEPLSLDAVEPESMALAEAISDANVETPEQALLQAERRLLLEASLARLLSHRNLLILRYSFLERYEVEEKDGRQRPFKWTDARIAQQVGLAPGSISTTRKRILQRLAADPELAGLVEEVFGPDWIEHSHKLSE